MKPKFLVFTAASALAAMLALTPHAFAQEVVTPSQSPDVAQFQKLEDTWSTAVANKDQYALENLLSPAFIGIAANGDVATRNQEVADLFQKGQPDLVSVEQKVVNVRIVEDLAVVDGTYIIKRKVNGAIREERGIFTHIYQRTRSSWVSIHSQRTPVVEQADGQKPKPQKKSTAEEPFHIPFFHKGADSTQTPAQPANSATPQN